MDTKRGAMVVAASVGALTAGWYIYRWYQKREHEEQLESEEMVREFDEAIDALNKPKRAKRSANGRHQSATS